MKRLATEEFRCPACGEGLSDHGGLACSRCERTYPIRDGIVDFRVGDHEYYFNPVPPDAMRTLVADMERDGWARTVAKFVSHVTRPIDWIDNLAADGRYAWKLLLDLRPDSVLLDVGCGLGNLSYNLAPHVGKVYAMDLTYERVAFARRRFETSNPGGHVVVLAGGDGKRLPFPDAALDHVVLSGVLEWVGEAGADTPDTGSKLVRGWRMVRSAFGRRSPRRVQLEFLREIRRVLKPTGQLFVAIENRTSYRYFLGDPDHHSGLRYSSLLPRPLANLYSIVVARRPYRTYTYSIPGHRRLLRQAGFSSADFFGFLPGYSHVREILPVAAGQARWRPERRPGWRTRLARAKYLVPAYGIVAGGRGPRPSLADRVVGAAEAALANEFGKGTIQLHGFRVTGKDKGVLTATYAGAPLVIKLPFGPAARTGEQANAAFLTLAKRGFAEQLAWIPASRAAGIVTNVPYFVEDRRPGTPLRHDTAGLGSVAAVAAVESVLERLNPQPLPAEALIGERYQMRVARRLETVAPLLPDPGMRSALDAFFRDRVYGLEIPRGVEHGDFGHDNILTERGRITGLIDWEAASVDGIPLLDALSFVEAAGRVAGRFPGLRQTIPLLARATWPEREEWAFLERQYKRWGVDLRHHEALVYLYWLQHVSSLAPYGLAYNASQVTESVVHVAAALLERT